MIQLDVPDYISLKDSQQLQLQRENDRKLKKFTKTKSIKSIYGDLTKGMMIEIDKNTRSNKELNKIIKATSQDGQSHFKKRRTEPTPVKKKKLLSETKSMTVNQSDHSHVEDDSLKSFYVADKEKRKSDSLLSEIDESEDDKY